MKEFTCIVCPNGCTLRAEETETGLRITGNRCKRGEEFGIKEMTAPVRSVCSTVRTIYPRVPVLPVRLSEPVPREMIFPVMKELKRVLVTGPVDRGDVVVKNVCGLGADVIATSNILNTLPYPNE